MTNEQYLKIQNRLFELMVEVKTYDLDQFISAINKSETVGPILDPTSFMAAQDKLKIIKKLAIGLKDFQNSFPDFSEVIDAELKQRMVLGNKC